MPILTRLPFRLAATRRIPLLTSRYYSNPIRPSTHKTSPDIPTAEETTPPPRDRPIPQPAPPPPRTESQKPGDDTYWGDQNPRATIPSKPPPSDKLAHNVTGQVGTLEINCAPGIPVPHGNRRELIGSILDLYKNLITRQKMAFWDDNCVFDTMIGLATGKQQVEAMWWTLQKSMKDVKVIEHEVLENDEVKHKIVLRLRTRYDVPAAGEVDVKSVVEVQLDPKGEKIMSLKEKWGDDVEKRNGPGGDSKILQTLRKTIASAAEKIVKPPKSD